MRFGLELLSGKHHRHKGQQPEQGIVTNFFKQGVHGAVSKGAVREHSRQRRANQECAKSGLMQRSKMYLYSITSAARASNAGGRVRPSAFAVFRLTMSSNLVG